LEEPQRPAERRASMTCTQRANSFRQGKRPAKKRRRIERRHTFFGS
jgi:hypothetical protein